VASVPPELKEELRPENGLLDVVDHHLYRAPDGCWRLWAAIRSRKPRGLVICGWCGGKTLKESDWQPEGVKVRSDPVYGEAREDVCSPFFFRHGDRLLCFYYSQGIRWMESHDGFTFRRVLDANDSSLSHTNGRDPMLLRVDGTVLAYSCVTRAPGYTWADSFVSVRTTRDFREWSDYTVVSYGGIGGAGPVSAESPFVAKRGDWFYLFRSSSIAFNTYVYRSVSPYDFGVGHDRNLVAILPLKAPEIISEDGQDYITDLADFEGIRMSRLIWEADDEPPESRWVALQRNHRKNEFVRPAADAG
jgi:hypothetical protein